MSHVRNGMFEAPAFDGALLDTDPARALTLGLLTFYALPYSLPSPHHQGDAARETVLGQATADTRMILDLILADHYAI